VIRPPRALDIRRIERRPAELEKAWHIGREVMEERVADVRAFLWSV